MSLIMVRCRSNDALEGLGDDEIVRYCYENDYITKEKAIEILGSEEKLKKHDYYCDVFFDEMDVLDSMDDWDLYDELCDRRFNFPIDEPEDEYGETKEEWINGIKRVFSGMFTRVYTKEDFKKEICKAIDDYYYGV